MKGNLSYNDKDNSTDSHQVKKERENRIITILVTKSMEEENDNKIIK